MSDDEVVVLIVCLILGAGLWISWLYRILSVSPMCSSTAVRLPALLSPLAGAVALVAVLRLYAAEDVCNSPLYMLFYTLMGAAWVAIGTRLVRWFGLSVRDDVAERNNAAASWAIAGAVLGLTLAFAGANIGNGPGWWVVVFSAALSTGGLFLLCFLLAKLTPVLDVITIDRDLAAGLRLGAFLAAAGLILGRSVAGDWFSAQATLRDFFCTAWRVLPLWALAVVAELILRPTAAQPRRSVTLCGLLPAAFYLAAAAMAVRALGAWS